VSNDIEQLLRIQAIDHQLTESFERVKRLQRDRERLEKKGVEADRAVAQQGTELQTAEHDSLMLNLQVDELDAQIRQYQHRLDTGIISFKEMEDLRTKIAMERERMSGLEDKALHRIDAVAQMQQDLQAARDGLLERHRELESAIQEVDSAIAEERSTQDGLQAQRSETTSSMSEFVLSQYASLRRKYANVVVSIDHGVCSGCKLRLSGSTIERVRGSSGIVACEHCGRVLCT
jgi:uncharacterized protein